MVAFNFSAPTAIGGFVSNLLGFNKKPAPAPQPKPITGDPNKIVGYINGRGYNYAGDFVTPAPPPATPAPDPAYQSLLAQIRALQANIVNPARIDVAGINARARSAAQAAVNPLYTQKLNDLLARQAVKRTRATEDYTTTVGDIEDVLQQKLEESQIGRTRQEEDTTANLLELRTQQERQQEDTGTAFDRDRLITAAALAASGLGQSGLGTQQIEQATDQKNLEEKRQGEDFDTARGNEAVLKARKFEDLARSDLLAGKSAEKGKKVAKVDLDRLIEDINFEEGQEKLSIETQRYIDLQRNQSEQAKAIFNTYLAGIKDPRVLAATAQAYGSLF